MNIYRKGWNCSSRRQELKQKCEGTKNETREKEPFRENLILGIHLTEDRNEIEGKNAEHLWHHEYAIVLIML